MSRIRELASKIRELSSEIHELLSKIYSFRSRTCADPAGSRVDGPRALHRRASASAVTAQLHACVSRSPIGGCLPFVSTDSVPCVACSRRLPRFPRTGVMQQHRQHRQHRRRSPPPSRQR